MKRKILFACHDIGPARYLEALMGALDEEYVVVPSHKSQCIFPEAVTGRLEDIDHRCIRIVVTGSSISDGEICIDKVALRWAKKHGIPTISIVEHWTWIRARFIVNGATLLPDRIFVNDELAKCEALCEGMPEDIICVAGNPRLEAVSHGTRIVTGEFSRRRFDLPEDKRIVLFVSEDLVTLESNHLSTIGYDEIRVIRDIRSLLGEDDHLVIKLHPDESCAKYTGLFSRTVTFIDCASPYDLSRAADVIIGMESMLLLEISVYRRDVISYIPIRGREFIGSKMGVTLQANSLIELDTLMSRDIVTPNSLLNYFDGSTDRCIKMIKEHAS